MWPNIQIDLGASQGEVHLYSLMMGCGLCTLFLGVDFTARRQGRSREMIANFHYCILAGFLFGLGSALVITKLFYGDKVAWGTVAAMPGIVAGAGAMVVSAWFFKVPLRDWLPLAVPFFCFAHAWGRLGCFFAGCCFGTPTDSFLGVQFPDASPACDAHGPVPVHPTQLYELVLLVAMGFTLHFAVPAAHRVSLYLLVYGAGRFVIEFFRGDNRGSLDLLPSLSPSQHICLLFIVAGAVLVWGQWRRPRQETAPT